MKCLRTFLECLRNNLKETAFSCIKLLSEMISGICKTVGLYQLVTASCEFVREQPKYVHAVRVA